MIPDLGPETYTGLPEMKVIKPHFCGWHYGYIFIQIFKPPPPVGAGGGYMFSGRPSVPLSVRASVRPSVIHVVVLCFRDISSISRRIFAKLLSLVHLRTEKNWLDFGVKRSKVKVTAWPNTSQIFMFPWYLQYLLTDFRQTCHWCILGHRWPDYVFGSKSQSSRSHHRGGGAQHSTLPSRATFSSCGWLGNKRIFINRAHKAVEGDLR